MRLFSTERNRAIVNKLPILLNTVLILLGIFVLLAMSVVWIVFEEFTAFTDYTQDWIEFNFFIHYWDRITISRIYLSFIFIYGAVILAIAAIQIHGLRKNNLTFMYFAPLLLVFVAVITVLGGICWLIVTGVNYDEGFLASGGFIFERMRFKGNVWKDLKYREQSWKIVTMNQVPAKATILKTWVHQRERDFECCGWDSYLDYKAGGFTELPEACCKRKSRGYGCGSNYLIEDKRSILNTRGCKNVMYGWYKRGFGVNIAMSVIGILIAAYEFIVFTINRKEYFKLLSRYNELKNMKIPMDTNFRPSRSNSKTSVLATPDMPLASDERPRIPLNIPMRNFYNQNDNDDDDNFETDDNLVGINFNNNNNNNTNRNRLDRNRIYRPNDGQEEEREWLN